VEDLVGDALATLAEFGAPGDDLQQLLDGPFADPQIRHNLQDKALRRTVRERVGRSLTTCSCRMEQDGKLIALAVAAGSISSSSASPSMVVAPGVAISCGASRRGGNSAGRGVERATSTLAA